MDKAYARPTARARELRKHAKDAERALWQAISARKVSGIRFNRQVPIGPYICDFVARSIGLVIEVDGGQHGDEADANRTSIIEAQGFRVIRFWNNEVLGNLDGVMAEIARVIADMPSLDGRHVTPINPSRKREGRLSQQTPWP
jgi:very-short-patch-repair endonuclease